ncbi:hypothetical protein E6C60_3183 [Paenibacillus algicola]|uniref:Uncharacterized protein n=1 Tax=Paenibacillus algicola TaxID=2565926 RepID=A0A4V1G493_9BACL|nr:hypothetical protein [Paenibacillus algicola]QCT03894.1 hypothetical protein E6C60_3183 [Paenibacillus algicola]
MEPIVCPWCQSEIVWDEEIGPEEHCPHCENELKGYRTINVEMDTEAEADEASEDEYSEDPEEVVGFNQPFWSGETTLDPGVRVLEQYGDDYDLISYEEGVEKALDHQDEVPECIHCREYMLFAGKQAMGGEGFQPVQLPHLQGPLLSSPIHVNMYVCSGCFQVQYTLDEDDRQRLIQRLSKPSVE